MVGYCAGVAIITRQAVYGFVLARSIFAEIFRARIAVFTANRMMLAVAIHTDIFRTFIIVVAINEITGVASLNGNAGTKSVEANVIGGAGVAIIAIFGGIMTFAICITLNGYARVFADTFRKMNAIAVVSHITGIIGAWVFIITVF